MAYFEAVGYYGRMVYGSYDQVAIQAAKWHILRLLVTMVGWCLVSTIMSQFWVRCDIFRSCMVQVIAEGCLFLKGNQLL